MIRFENVRKKGTLSNVTLTLDSGRVCVLSERESDAPAILNLSCGLTLPDSGTLTSNGKVRFIAQNAPIPRFLKVSQYFDTVRNIVNDSNTPKIASEIEEEYGNDVIGTLDDLDRYYVALSAALIGSPAAVAVVAPFHGVPYEHREKLNEFLDELSETVTVLYTSVYPSLCRENEQVIVLSSGKCVGNGTANEIFNMQSPTLVCKVKGNIDRLDLSEIITEYTVTPTNGGIYEITFNGDGKELRENVKEAIARGGMALLSVKGEHDELKRVISALDKLEAEEAEQVSLPSEPEKLSAESLSISGDDEPQTKTLKKSLKMIGFYSDEDNQDDTDGDESTLFSDEGSEDE